MSINVLPLEDGSWLLMIANLPNNDIAPTAHPDRPFLGLSDFLAEAATAGAIGNLTYASLRIAADRLRTRLGAPPAPPPSANDVTKVVTDFLTNSGYHDITVAEFGAAGDEGFFVRGHADRHRFDARTEPSGTLVHLRVD